MKKRTVYGYTNWSTCEAITRIEKSEFLYNEAIELSIETQVKHSEDMWLPILARKLREMLEMNNVLAQHYLKAVNYYELAEAYL